MRKLITVLFSCFLAVALAGSAGALTIDPNPVNQQRTEGAGSPLDADVYLISIVDDIMTLQLSVTTGSIDEIDVQMLFTYVPFDTNIIVDAGTNAGTGDVAVLSSVYTGGTKAEFAFDDDNDKVDAGETSDEFWVQFADPIASDWTGVISFDAGTLVQDTSYVTVPEPSTSLLMLLAAGVGLVVARRHF